jgi:hypothetical protein
MKPAAMVLVKNERYWLPYVLKQTEGHFDSYVIYDVGSNDGTLEIIDWFYERNKEKAQIKIRKLPHCEPIVQGTFRNAMIVDGERPVYLILDGDELYTQKSMSKIADAANTLDQMHEVNTRIKYGVFRRIEVLPELTQRYSEVRTHHRLYTADTPWKGTHPGEEPVYGQNTHSEIHFDDIVVWHMHNTLRSPKEEDALSRIRRKQQKTYRPGNAIQDMDLIKRVPMLAERVEHFEVTPALAILQERARNDS